MPSVEWRECLRQKPEWYGGAEASRIAENVLLHQRCSGGWPKNVDMSRTLTAAEVVSVVREKAQADATIDNEATFTQIRFLARVHAAKGIEGYRLSYLAGLRYLLEAQYPSGGWPQFYPLRPDYSRLITFNDDAMIGVMELLRDVAAGKPPFPLVDADLRSRSREAIERGLRVILKSQVLVDGRPTVWCAQVDPMTFEPRGARSYEHPSLSGRESVAITKYLMGIEGPDPAVEAAVEGAIAWFRRAAIPGIRIVRKPDSSAPRGFDVVVENDPGAAPLWARFYDLGTGLPIFSGRDGVVKSSLAEIEIERRTGYSWLGPYASELLERDYPAWRRRSQSAVIDVDPAPAPSCPTTR